MTWWKRTLGEAKFTVKAHSRASRSSSRRTHEITVDADDKRHAANLVAAQIGHDRHIIVRRIDAHGEPEARKARQDAVDKAHDPKPIIRGGQLTPYAHKVLSPRAIQLHRDTKLHVDLDDRHESKPSEKPKLKTMAMHRAEPKLSGPTRIGRVKKVKAAWKFERTKSGKLRRKLAKPRVKKTRAPFRLVKGPKGWQYQAKRRRGVREDAEHRSYVGWVKAAMAVNQKKRAAGYRIVNRAARAHSSFGHERDGEGPKFHAQWDRVANRGFVREQMDEMYGKGTLPANRKFHRQKQGNAYQKAARKPWDDDHQVNAVDDYERHRAKAKRATGLMKTVEKRYRAKLAREDYVDEGHMVRKKTSAHGHTVKVYDGSGVQHVHYDDDDKARVAKKARDHFPDNKFSVHKGWIGKHYGHYPRKKSWTKEEYVFESNFRNAIRAHVRSQSIENRQMRAVMDPDMKPEEKRSALKRLHRQMKYARKKSDAYARNEALEEMMRKDQLPAALKHYDRKAIDHSDTAELHWDAATRASKRARAKRRKSVVLAKGHEVKAGEYANKGLRAKYLMARAKIARNEEVVSELSKGKLGAYVSKAVDSRDKINKDVDNPRLGLQYWKKLKAKGAKRRQGIDTALNKLVRK